MVCICIPTFNAATTIKETLKSILAQTYENFVIHISDNASTDQTLAIVESFRDPRIEVHRHTRNIGGEGNFNRCINLAEGEYSVIFHADDIYEPNIISKQVQYLQKHPKACAVFTAANFIDDSGMKIGAHKLPKELSEGINQYSFQILFKMVLQYYNFFICSSVMIRTKILKNEIKVWRPELFGSSADLDVWLRLSMNHPIGFLSEPLIRYRLSKSQFSHGVRSRTKRADFFRVIDYYLASNTIGCDMKKVDYDHLNWLLRSDIARRALSFFMDDKFENAYLLCSNQISTDAFRAASKSRRGFFTLLLILYINLFYFLRMPRVGKFIMSYFKFY